MLMSHETVTDVVMMTMMTMMMMMMLLLFCCFLFYCWAQEELTKAFDELTLQQKAILYGSTLYQSYMQRRASLRLRSCLGDVEMEDQKRYDTLVELQDCHVGLDLSAPWWPDAGASCGCECEREF